MIVLYGLCSLMLKRSNQVPIGMAREHSGGLAFSSSSPGAHGPPTNFALSPGQLQWLN